MTVVAPLPAEAPKEKIAEQRKKEEIKQIKKEKMEM
jgi:hypothetical protein